MKNQRRQKEKVTGLNVPAWATKQLMASGTVVAVRGGYTGASKSRRQTYSFNPRAGDSDSDTIRDLPTLRARGRDLTRNNPIAAGAVGTNCVHIVGGGLKMQSRIDRKTLGMKEDEAEEWQRNTETEFKTWADSLDCDISRRSNFYDLQNLVLRSTLESGDVFVLLPFKMVSTSHYGLRLQVVEADRVSNEKNSRDTENLVAGIEKDKNGTPKMYHVRTTHPGSTIGKPDRRWNKIPAFTKSGRRNIIHVFEQLRPGQSRGIPYLAPVIEKIHELGKYTDAEIMNAVISSYFTVFIKTPTGNVGLSPFQSDLVTGGTTTDKDYKLGMGAIVELANDEEVHFADPKRPNTSFDQFMQAILRQIGVALGLPFELLVMHFTKSYSAARSAMLNAWKVFLSKREWLINHFCNIVYDVWMEEAVLRGRVIAPGFLDDPVIRKAYLGVVWIGPSQGSIDPLREMTAVEKRLDLKISTLAEETEYLTGVDWDGKIDRFKREAKIVREIQGILPNGQRSIAVDPDSEKELEDGDGEDDE